MLWLVLRYESHSEYSDWEVMPSAPFPPRQLELSQFLMNQGLKTPEAPFADTKDASPLWLFFPHGMILQLPGRDSRVSSASVGCAFAGNSN